MSGFYSNDFPDLSNLINDTIGHLTPRKDEKRWSLTANGNFSVKSFYNFLNDGGLQCSKTPVILQSLSPRKINLFNWLAWDDKILKLENLARRRRNLFQSTT